MKIGSKAVKNTLKRMMDRYAKVEGCEPQAALRDLLTDLRHLSDELNLDFHSAMNGSYEVYLEERAEASKDARKKRRKA